MAIQQEVWLNDIQGNIFPNSEFFMQSVDDSPFVLNGKVVHIPQAGAKPNVVKNRTSLPAAITTRTDTEETYNLDEFTTDPILLQDTEAIEISYAKRQNILSEHQARLNEEIADWFAYYWGASLGANIARTTGTARAGTAPSATGNRKAVAKADLIEVNRLMNRMNVPGSGRKLLIPADFEADILKIDDFVHADKIGSAKLTEGAIGRLLGFDVFVRSKTTIYDNTGTPVRKAPGAAGAAADNLSALAWHPSLVSRAKGEVKIFIEEDKPEYYGDVFSALVRAGGRKRRTDEVGVISLVEAAE